VTEDVDGQDARGIAEGTRRVAGLTLVSRVLGFARDCICAHVFGGGREWSAFAFAFMVPNLFRRVFGEGALSAAFIPAFARKWEEEGPAAAWRLFRRTFGALLGVLVGLAGLLALGVVLSRFFLADKAGGALEFPLLLCLAPYLPIICLVAFFGAALQARKRFTLPALAPVINNVFWIAAAVVALRVAAPLSARIFLLPAGIVLGTLLALALHVPALRRLGARGGPEIDLRDEGDRSVAANVAPVIVGLSIVQFNVFIDGLIARTLISDVANSHLYYANRLFQFPLAMLGISMGTVVFPTLAELHARKEHGEARKTATGALDLMLFLALPAAVGLAIMAGPVIRLLFEHGAFGAAKTATIAPILACYAFGLPAACANHVLVRVFYTAGDTRTPVRVAVVAMVLNLALNLTLIWFLREAGLALATAISAWVQSIVLAALIARRLGMLETGALALSLARAAGIGGAMGVAVHFALGACTGVLGEVGLVPRTLTVAIPIVAGALVFLVLAWMFGRQQLKAILPGRKGSSSRGGASST